MTSSYLLSASFFDNPITQAALILIFALCTLYNKNVSDIIPALALAFLFDVIQRIIIATGCLSCKTKGRYSYQMCAASQQLGARGCLTFPDQRGAVLDVYIYLHSSS